MVTRTPFPIGRLIRIAEKLKQERTAQLTTTTTTPAPQWPPAPPKPRSRSS